MNAITKTATIDRAVEFANRNAVLVENAYVAHTGEHMDRGASYAIAEAMAEAFDAPEPSIETLRDDNQAMSGGLALLSSLNAELRAALKDAREEIVNPVQGHDGGTLMLDVLGRIDAALANSEDLPTITDTARLELFFGAVLADDNKAPMTTQQQAMIDALKAVDNWAGKTVDTFRTIIDECLEGGAA